MNITDKNKGQEMDYLDLLHCKFTYKGTSIEEGFDCFTLVIEMGKRRGIKIPNINRLNISLEQTPLLFDRQENYDLFEEVKRAKDTLVLLKNPFGVIGHVGYMLDRNNFIHMTENEGCQVSKVTDRMWKNRIIGYYLPKEYVKNI